MNMLPDTSDSSRRFQALPLVLATAIGLTMWFWLDLWLGGGLIGGDVYTYYFPQKAFYSSVLKAGTIPVWNPLVGHGYPLVAESQTGVFYPPNLVLYRLFDVNTAYNINHLLHYVLAFVGTVWFVRGFGISPAGSVLAALSFVYGWFAPRCCLEWAILTGAWMPVCLGLMHRFFQRKRPLWLWLLAGAITLQLLPGHFHLAFITQLCLVLWTVGVLAGKWKKNEESLSEREPAETHSALAVGAIALSIGLGFAMASLQLLPTWALKQNSQRETATSREFNPAYGHIRPRYLTQTFMPWHWYDEPRELADRLNQRGPLTYPAATNPVEAHLYFGLVPFALAAWGCFHLHQIRDGERWSLTLWILMGILAMVYATGWLLPLFQYLPGFDFFRGTGRYGIATSLAVAILAGFGWDQLRQKLNRSTLTNGLYSLLFVLTLLDLSWVSQKITYAFMVPETPLNRIEESVVRELLIDRNPPARLFGPGQNLLTITGVAATPVYLGLGPEEYFDPELTYPADDSPEEQTHWKTFTGEQLDWMRRAGVTHVLTFQPPDPKQEALKLTWQGIDPFLNRAWGRREPLYLSQLAGTRGRVAWEKSSKDTSLSWSDSPSRREIHVTTPVAQSLILTELFDEDWQAFLDGEPVESERKDGMYRAVDVPAGEHEIIWRYQPGSLHNGIVASIAAFTIWAAMGMLVFRRRIR